MATSKKASWEMNYGELFEDWASRYAFGAKGEIPLHEAKEIHVKWRSLGKAAKRGIL